MSENTSGDWALALATWFGPSTMQTTATRIHVQVSVLFIGTALPEAAAVLVPQASPARFLGNVPVVASCAGNPFAPTRHSRLRPEPAPSQVWEPGLLLVDGTAQAITMVRLNTK